MRSADVQRSENKVNRFTLKNTCPLRRILIETLTFACFYLREAAKDLGLLPWEDTHRKQPETGSCNLTLGSKTVLF